MTSTAWNATCAQVAAWYAQHGQAPSSQSTNPAEKQLGQWVRQQRNAYRNGTMSPDRAAQLESIPGWVWDPAAAAWNTTCAQVAAWYAQHGRAPSIQSTDPAEKRLAQWVSAQRAAYKRGTLDPARVAHLEAIPGWTWTAR